MRISAIARYNQEELPCLGEILLESIHYPTAYVTWKLFSYQGLMAAKSANLYFPYGEEETDRLFETVLAYIPTYRIGRKRLFTQVQVVA